MSNGGLPESDVIRFASMESSEMELQAIVQDVFIELHLIRGHTQYLHPV